MTSDQTKILVDWLEQSDLRRIRNLDELLAAIAIQIADIDEQFVKIVRSVLTHPRFQQLESSFRGIYQLISSACADASDVRNMPQARRVNVFVLDISAQELQADLTANSYRQTWIFDKLYRKRFDLLIGEQNVNIDGYSAVYPFSLMVVDFDFSLDEEKQESDRRSPKISQIDLPAVRKLAKVGEECFCMFLMSLSPRFFGDGFESFSQLENVIDVHSILRGARYRAWNDFRQQEESRMIGVTMPRVLVRKPYKNHVMGRSRDGDGNVEAATGIVFNEFDGFETGEKMLWGRSSFAVVQPIVRSFKQYDWFSDVSGIDRNIDALPTSEDDDFEPGYDGGLIEEYPNLFFDTDTEYVANYSPAEIIISETDEAAYSSVGLIPVFSINQSPYIATLSSQSVQQPKDFSTEESSNNLRLSSMFNYMLCICRMAHRLKIEVRSQVGKSGDAEGIQDHMQRWLMEHSSGRNRGLEQKMIKPFLDEQTGFYVFEDVTDPGRYDCTIRLCPHHKYDNGNVKLVFEPVALRMQLNDDGGKS